MTSADKNVVNGVNIAIVAPGGYAPDEVALERGIALLETQGCRVHNYYKPSAKHLRFGGTDDDRIAQINAAACDPEIQVVMALRGSYGMSRLLPILDFNMLANSGKLFVGHSDFTAFHMALLAHSDTVSFAGPMLCDDFTRPDVSQFTMDHFWACLHNSEHAITFQATNNPAVTACGTLWGGNLAMMTHLLGSAYFPQIDEGILFVEDVNEHPFRVERMMLQLLHAGVLQRQKAILFGDFSNHRLSDYDNGYNFDTMLAYLRARVSVPILTGLPFGHIRDKATLAVGSLAEIVSHENAITLSMSRYPCL